MTQSRRFVIASALVAAVRDAPALAGAKFRRNPTDPFNIKDGPRVVFFEDEVDDGVDQKGAKDGRRFVFSLGVINRTTDAEAQADADHVAACEALRAAANAIAATNPTARLTEAQTVFKVESADVGGALILTTFEQTYRRL